MPVLNRTPARRPPRPSLPCLFEHTSDLALLVRLYPASATRGQPATLARAPRRIHMPNDHNRPEPPGRQPGDAGPNDPAAPVQETAEQHVMAAESARNEAEEFRRLAEETREVRDHHRDALESIREERERLRETAEVARSASEEARSAAEAAREAVVDAVRATAASLDATLAQMKVVEEMRRTLREIKDAGELESN